MLRMTTRSASRAAHPYICSTCVATRHVGLGYPSTGLESFDRARHTRFLSTTSRRRNNVAAEQTPEPSADSPTNELQPSERQAIDPRSPSQPSGSKKKPRARASKAKPPPITPALQGAIDTFKKVLAEQNVDLAHLTKIFESKPETTKKSKIKIKKSKAKKSKAKSPPSTSDATPDALPSSTPISVLEIVAETTKETQCSASDVAPTIKPAPTPTSEATSVTAGDASGLQSNILGNGEDHAGIGGARSHALGVSDPQGKPFGPDGENVEVSTESEKKTGSKKDASGLSIDTIRAEDLQLTPIGELTVPVPRLSYGLDRVLFNPGVYFLQDPRSRVYNFDPYLAEIMPIKEFDFNALKQYITSSKDTTLIGKAKEHKKRYTGSTSSMTAMLSHFHYLLSSWRPIDASMMSAEFKPESSRFTRIMRAPAATFLHWKDGCYAIDADKEYDSANILSMLGKSMEKLLTLPKHEFERYRTVNSDQISEEERNADEAFHYTGFQDFMMRSQLDAHDNRIPGTGMFDLKTRAVISIRMDAKNFHKGLGYEIRTRTGQWESFEREYYDMIRSAFLKYSLQVRMGRMDGIYVAFHNTERIFGFQYIPLPEMDKALHGTHHTGLGDQEYKLSLSLLNQLLDRATKRWPEKSLRVHFETRESIVAPFMYVFARPVADGDIQAVQNAGKAQVEEFERSVLGLGKKESDKDSCAVEATIEATQASETAEPIELEESSEEIESAGADQDAQRLAAWGEVQQMVEDAMDDEEQGLSLVREAIRNALEESKLLEVETTAEAREYIDALLAAITGTQQPPTQSSISGAGLDKLDAPEDTEHEKALDGNTGSVAKASDDATPSPAGSGAQSTLSNELVAEGGRGSQATPASSPMKDLIALSAQRIYARPATDVDICSIEEDQSKLKVFETILGRLISQGKAEEAESTIPRVDTQTSPTGLEQADALSSADGPLSDHLDVGDEEVENVSAPETASRQEEEEEDVELLGMVLTIKNKINGKYVDRPDIVTKTDKWEVEYNIEEIADERAQTLYRQMLTRRKTIFMGVQDKRGYESIYGGELVRSTQRGRLYRAREKQSAKFHPVRVYGRKPWSSRKFDLKEPGHRAPAPPQRPLALTPKKPLAPTPAFQPLAPEKSIGTKPSFKFPPFKKPSFKKSVFKAKPTVSKGRIGKRREHRLASKSDHEVNQNTATGEKIAETKS